MVFSQNLDIDEHLSKGFILSIETILYTSFEFRELAFVTLSFPADINLFRTAMETPRQYVKSAQN